jgi:hypothetical protein
MNIKIFFEIQKKSYLCMNFELKPHLKNHLFEENYTMDMVSCAVTAVFWHHRLLGMAWQTTDATRLGDKKRDVRFGSRVCTPRHDRYETPTTRSGFVGSVLPDPTQSR